MTNYNNTLIEDIKNFILMEEEVSSDYLAERFLKTKASPVSRKIISSMLKSVPQCVCSEDGASWHYEERDIVEMGVFWGRYCENGKLISACWTIDPRGEIDEIESSDEEEILRTVLPIIDGKKILFASSRDQGMFHRTTLRYGTTLPCIPYTPKSLGIEDIKTSDSGIDLVKHLLEKIANLEISKQNLSPLISENIRDTLSNLPTYRGVYALKNREGKILSIGRVCNIRESLTSFFSVRDSEPNQWKELISKSDSITPAPSLSEAEASLTESALIKKYSPPFNRVQIKIESNHQPSDKIVVIPSDGETVQTVWFGPKSTALLKKIKRDSSSEIEKNLRDFFNIEREKPSAEKILLDKHIQLYNENYTVINYREGSESDIIKTLFEYFKG